MGLLRHCPLAEGLWEWSLLQVTVFMACRAFGWLRSWRFALMAGREWAKLPGLPAPLRDQAHCLVLPPAFSSGLSFSQGVCP